MALENSYHKNALGKFQRLSNLCHICQLYSIQTVPTIIFSFVFSFLLLSPTHLSMTAHNLISPVSSSQLQGHTTLTSLQNSGIKLSIFSLQSVKYKPCLLFKKKKTTRLKNNNKTKQTNKNPVRLKNLVYAHIWLSSFLLLGLYLDYTSLKRTCLQYLFVCIWIKGLWVSPFQKYTLKLV